MRIHGLTPKQERFVGEYLKDLNATKACIRAGYSRKFADSLGPRLVRKSRVLREIIRRQERRAARLEINQDKWLAEYSKVAFADMKAFAEWSEAGVRLKNSDELDPEDTAAIAEVSENQNQFGVNLRIKLHSKTAALEAIGKHLGFFRELPIETFDAFLTQLPGDLATIIRQLAVKAIQSRNPDFISGEPITATPREADS